MTDNNVSCVTAGIQSGTADAATEKLPVTPSESLTSDQRDSGDAKLLCLCLKTVSVLN